MKKIIIILLFLTSFIFAESLWQGERSGLFNDSNARNIGDSLTIVVVESVTSKQQTNSNMNNASQVSMGPGTGFASFLNTSTSFPNQSSFKASGAQTSEGELKTEITVQVVGIQPNGELIVSGNKVTDINGEKQVMEVSGIVRPLNIMSDNKVYSTSLANAKITYKRLGEMHSNEEPGYITKIFNMVF